jgi:hypothetical protein
VRIHSHGAGDRRAGMNSGLGLLNLAQASNIELSALCVDSQFPVDGSRRYSSASRDKPRAAK